MSAPFRSRWMNFSSTPTVRADETDRSHRTSPSVSSGGSDPSGEKEDSEAKARESAEHLAVIPVIVDPVIVAARLLRECRWAFELPVCAFLIGSAGERCQRCGASWMEHYSPGR
jgi:hypothetical protein